MPDGLTHRKYHKRWQFPVFAVSTVVFGIIAISLAVSENLYQAAYVLEFWFWINVWYSLGSVIDPDLDLLGVSKSEGEILKRYGILGVFIFAYSSLYAASMHYIAMKFKVKGLFGAHRSWLTHSPIGTLIRVIFVNAPLAYLYQIVSVSLLAFDIRFEFSHLDLLVFFAAQLVGLGIADGIHVYLDSRE